MPIWDRDDETEWEKYQRSKEKQARREPAFQGEPEEPAPEREPLLGRLAERLRERAKSAEEPPVTPEVCPWCGGEMVRGYLWAGGNNLLWLPRKPKPWVSSVEPGPDELEVGQEGALWRYKTAWRCPACQKLTLDLAAETQPTDGGAQE